MPAWGDDPELLATFRAEVEERLASLQSGLLQLETHSSPRQVVTVLFRDAHTVKGSARMLGLVTHPGTDEPAEVAGKAAHCRNKMQPWRVFVRS